MFPFIIDRSWYETHWYGPAPVAPPRATPRARASLTALLASLVSAGSNGAETVDGQLAWKLPPI